MDKKDIGHLTKLISDAVRARVDTQLKKYDLTCSQMRILRYLQINNGKATQKQLEDFLEVSHPTVVGLINRLEKNGFVECHFDNNNRRHKIVCAGEKAVSFYKDMEADRKRTEELLLNNLTPQEINELERLLNVVYNNVKK